MNKSLAIICSILSIHLAFAQKPHCGTDEYYKYQLQNNPNLEIIEMIKVNIDFEETRIKNETKIKKQKEEKEEHRLKAKKAKELKEENKKLKKLLQVQL